MLIPHAKLFLHLPNSQEFPEPLLSYVLNVALINFLAQVHPYFKLILALMITALTIFLRRVYLRKQEASHQINGHKIDPLARPVKLVKRELNRQ